MRVLMLGDTHGDAEWCESATKVAGRCGASHVLQVGDFGWWPRALTRAGHRQSEHLGTTIARACRRHGVHGGWIMIAGNHEDHDALDRATITAFTKPADQGLVALVEDGVRFSPNGNTFQLGEVTFGTLGGAVSIDAWLETTGFVFMDAYGRESKPYAKGIDWFPDLEAPSAVEASILKHKKIDVLLTHDAPAGVDLGHCSGFTGIDIPPNIQARAHQVRELIREVVDGAKPQLLVHGHWHHRYSDLIRAEDGHVTRVEGLAHNGRRNGRDHRSYIVLDLPNLDVIDGGHVQKLWQKEKS